ncbi:MAG: winged helix-turn-helix transcriptional regulator [Candidatus Bathyarchaeia archaeon]
MSEASQPLTPPLRDADEASKRVRKDSSYKDCAVCPFLKSYYSRILEVFELAAEQGGIRSYVIYLLFINGKMNFYEILKEVGMTPQYVNRILKELKKTGVIDVNDVGYWFLIK